MNQVDKKTNTRFGFFDSGMGGFFMMQSCMETYPEYDYIYLGDTKNLPYGPKSSKEILEHMTPHLLWLIEEQNCDHVVIACNTASAQALGEFKKLYPQYIDKLVNIVEITQDYLKKKVPNSKEILVLATLRTVESAVYTNIAHHEVTQLAMPGLVDLIEENDRDGAFTMISDALSYYTDINYLLLGCTHYIDLEDVLDESYADITILGQDIILIDYIENHMEIYKTSEQQGKIDCYVSSNPESYTNRFKLPFKKMVIKKH